jgi:ferrochelatase
MSDLPYDAVVVVSFGGPEGPTDVLPFLENVTRGRNIPRERLLEVAHHYELFGGVSPINEQNRALIAALVSELNARGPQLPVYWANRNWHPLLPDTLCQMADDGIRHALAFVTSAFGSYSGCRQYLENIEQARAEAGPDAPAVDKLRVFYNHPGFIGPMAQRVRAAVEQIEPARRTKAAIVFSAHSIPTAMARSAPYERQLQEACGLVAERVGPQPWQLAFQSRSGPPQQPWLQPDVADCVRSLHAAGTNEVVIAPIGFISDHMEVVYDLDIELRQVCDELGVNMYRAGTVGTHPEFVSMIRELIAERVLGAPRRYLGDCGPSPDVCPQECCRVRRDA